jgi:hypothetical protein
MDLSILEKLTVEETIDLIPKVRYIFIGNIQNGRYLNYVPPVCEQFGIPLIHLRRSQGPRSLGRRSAAAPLLGLPA